MMEERERDRSGRDRKRGCVGERTKLKERQGQERERERQTDRKKQGLVKERQEWEREISKERPSERERYGWEKRER